MTIEETEEYKQKLQAASSARYSERGLVLLPMGNDEYALFNRQFNFVRFVIIKGVDLSVPLYVPRKPVNLDPVLKIKTEGLDL